MREEVEYLEDHTQLDMALNTALEELLQIRKEFQRRGIQLPVENFFL